MAKPTPKKKSNTAFLAVILVVLVAGGAAIWTTMNKSKPIPTELAAGTPLPEAQGYLRGDPNAPITIIEFADFECPGCGQFAAVQVLGDVEVSLFMVALFVGVLVAYLRQSNADLRTALDNVHQLSSMLPLCAWCKNVRDDDGYWRRIEEYLSEHQVNVTHGMCESCAAQHFGGSPAA